MFRRVLALIIVAVVSTGAVAHAETFKRSDPVGDVVRQGAAGGTRVAAQTLENTDLIRIMARHTSTRFVTRLRYDSFSKAGFEEIYVVQVLRTSDQQDFSIFVRLDHKLKQADVSISEADTGLAVDCPGRRAEVNRDAKRVRWAIPRKCLDSPSWIRFRGHAGSVTENVVRFADDMLTAHEPGNRFSPKLASN